MAANMRTRNERWNRTNDKVIVREFIQKLRWITEIGKELLICIGKYWTDLSKLKSPILLPFKDKIKCLRSSTIITFPGETRRSLFSYIGRWTNGWLSISSLDFRLRFCCNIKSRDGYHYWDSSQEKCFMVHDIWNIARPRLGLCHRWYG
jgi:hypothetical protein